MHIEKILQNLLKTVMHQKRLCTLILFVHTVFHTKILNLTNLGRASSISIQERSGIRKADRFLGNKGIQTEKIAIYEQTIKLIVGSKTRPKIIVDWSPVPNSTDQILRAAIIAKGRALTLYEEVHPQKKYNNARVHNFFLEQFKEMLPEACVPIVISDAGFHNPWFEQVVSLGWNYVGRIRGDKYYQLPNEDWAKIKTLHQQATKTPTYIGEVNLCKENTLKTHLYIVKESAKGRKALTKAGKVRQDSASKKHSKAAQEPWVLVSSLPITFNIEKKVYKIYKERMQIEESFRDLKSTKFGFGFEHVRTKSCERLAVFLLIVMLASLLACLTGWCLEKLNHQFQYQANSIKHKRVLSLFFLGCRAIKRNHIFNLSEFFAAYHSLPNYAEE